MSRLARILVACFFTVVRQNMAGDVHLGQIARIRARIGHFALNGVTGEKNGLLIEQLEQTQIDAVRGHQAVSGSPIFDTDGPTLWEARHVRAAEDMELRLAAMRWLDRRPTPRVDFAWLRGFEYDGHRIPLMDRQRGIRKPAGMNAALAIRTTFTPPGQVPPYTDTIGHDGLQRYRYRGTDPDHPENVALRYAMQQKLPLIWFVGVESGLYEPIYPVWIIGDEPESLAFALALDEGQRFVTPGAVEDEDARRYVERVTKARLHQRVFRSRVLLAYDGRCAICRLRHAELLDAAHIIEDGRPNGEPVVPNGLSLCKIHHGAFDAKILGIRPDLTLHVRRDVLEEVDGWMLEGGIQGIHDKKLEIIPGSRHARPDPVRLELRYHEFLAAG